MFMQLWALGRTASQSSEWVHENGPHDVVSASAIPISEKHPTPRPLRIDEIKQYVQWYAQAAKNAVRAGFDGTSTHFRKRNIFNFNLGVEVHSASGYLPDQFLQTTSNERTDDYGGSIENRIRFITEVIDAIAMVIGAERTSLRLSPWSTFQSMRMPDPKPTFSALVKYLVEHHPRLAYIHLVERRIDGANNIGDSSDESSDFLLDIWSPRPVILAGGFNRELALQATDRNHNVLVAMGRYYISNPDLPKRWMHGVGLAPYDRQTFYTPGRGPVPKGYIDYPFSPDIKA